MKKVASFSNWVYLPERVKYDVGQIQADLMHSLSFLEKDGTSFESPGHAIRVRLFTYSSKNAGQTTLFSGLFDYLHEN